MQCNLQTFLMLVPACDGFLFLSSESLTETQCSQLQIKDEEKGSNQMREQSLEPSRPQDSVVIDYVNSFI